MQGDVEMRPVFTFVLPAFDEVENLRPLAARLHAVGTSLGEAYEIVWVNDGSRDGTAEMLDALAAEDARVRPIHFSRNFGHMAALTAGLEAARATGAVICLDSDGQHPPELVPEMVTRWRAGADIVQMQRSDTEREGLLKRVTSRGFYRVMNGLADIEIPNGASDFRLLDRQVVDALNSLPERVRFMRGLVFWVGFQRAVLPYEAPARMAGETKYGMMAMLRFAANGITSFSHRPLRISFFMGSLVAVLIAVYGVFVLWCYLAGIPLEPGWTSLLLTVMVLGCAQLFAIGIASEYLGRIFMEQKHRPVYLIRKPSERGARGASDDGAAADEEAPAHVGRDDVSQ